MLSIRLSTEARCFFVVRSETERVSLRSKLGQCPKMMVGMLLESCGKTKSLHMKTVEGVRVGKVIV